MQLALSLVIESIPHDVHQHQSEILSDDKTGKEK